MTNILVVLMLTVCPQANECYEEAPLTWQASSTNALMIALDQCDIKAAEALEEHPNEYYRCVIEAEEG